MPILIFKDFDGNIRQIEVNSNDNDDLIRKAEELGVPFGCTDGRCASCRVKVIEGGENLSDLTGNEKALGMNKKEPYRLMCQCKIKDGIVKGEI